MKQTKTRSTVLAILKSAQYPLSVADIEHQVTADPVTIYRILDIFVREQLARRIEFGEGKFRYEIADRPHHHHVICTSCGAVADVDALTETDLDAVAAKKTGYTIASHSLEFFGLCPICQ